MANEARSRQAVLALLRRANPEPDLEALVRAVTAPDHLAPTIRRNTLATKTTELPSSTRPRRNWAPVLAAVVILTILGGLVVALRANSRFVAATTLACEPSSALPQPTTFGVEGWSAYESDRYCFRIGYPPDWHESSATRDWTMEADANDWMSVAQESFVSPRSDIKVSAWAVALETAIDDMADVETWVGQYCDQTTYPFCDQAIEGTLPLCYGPSDCRPAGLLVNFGGVEASFDAFEGVQAIFTNPEPVGGDSDRMIVVAVWRQDDHPSVALYGGARTLLEGFLSTMNIWLPLEARSCLEGESYAPGVCP